MVKKFILFSLVLLVFLTIGVYAQTTPQPVSNPQVVMETISSLAQIMGPDDSGDRDVRTINTLRDPTIEDIVDAMKKKKQVTIVIWQQNNTSKWAHALRVRAINITSFNTTNDDNETVIQYNAKVYDPTTNKTYETNFAYVFNKPDKGYVNWNGWAAIRDVVTLYKVKKAPFPRAPKMIQPYGYLDILSFYKLLY
jgi:exopolysaccharide biosynthesis protein